MVRFGTVNVESRNGQHFFRVEVFPGGLKPDALRVELYADPVQENASALVAMTASKSGVDSSEAQIYCAQMSANRPTSDYTPRIVPYHPSATIPLEATQILWQR